MTAGADALDTIVAQWHAVLPGLDTSGLSVLGRIQRVAALADPLLRPPFARAGLASGDFDVLAALRRSGGAGLSPTDLAAAMLVTPGAATKRVDRLEAADLVTRGLVGGRDGRAKVICLTEAGRELTDRLIEQHLDAEAELVSALSAEELVVLTGLLRRLLMAVEDRRTASVVTEEVPR